MLHVAIDNGDNRSRRGECAFNESAAQATTPDPLDAVDTAIAPGNFTNPVSRSIRAVIINNDDLVVVPFQGGLNGGHQNIDAFDLVERRHHNCEFECVCVQLGIVVRAKS